MVLPGKLRCVQQVLGVTAIGIPRLSRTVGKLTTVSSSATHLHSFIHAWSVNIHSAHTNRRQLLMAKLE
jgi:hypothetical protein